MLFCVRLINTENTMQEYYKVFEVTSCLYWDQDKQGRTETRGNAGWWSAGEIECMNLGSNHRLILFRPSESDFKSRELLSGWAL